ncbi:MAG TPA: hypothetical protein VGR90_02590 [Acidimicrobiales bacterium]|nr:hypothetical protein [Acidimicrobiales bacterium]
MIVVDEYLAVRALRGTAPSELLDEDLVLPTSRHWRLLQALHGGRGGQLSRLLGQLSDSGQLAVRFPHPEVLQVLDPRPLLDEAAALAARFNNTGWLTAETLAAARHHGQALWFGEERNVGHLLREAADELGIRLEVAPG